MARYLEDWERVWQQVSPDGANGNGNDGLLSFALRWCDLTDGATDGSKL